MKHIIVIDDTGSPGDIRETKFLKKDRKSLVGVFIHSKNREHLELTIKKIISTLYSQFGITEIHLTDLVNRKNEYSQISSEDALSIIMLLSNWFASIHLPYFVQTCNKQTFKENGIPLQGKLDNFNFNNGEDQALFLLILHIKKFMNAKFPNDEVEIIMDEGRKNRHRAEKFKILEGFVAGSQIKYSSSKEFQLLQIADFFAYSINRTQMTIMKENKTDSDKKIYEFLSLVLIKQFSVGTSTIEADIANFTIDDYDYYQYTQRQIDENLDNWRNNQCK